VNRFQKWLIRKWLYKKAKEDKMWQIVLCVLAYIVKNSAMIIGIFEAVAKAITSIITLTPTKRDDALIPYVDRFFSAIKRILYSISETLTQ